MILQLPLRENLFIHVEKNDIIFLGLFTTRPVHTYHIDKLQTPPAIFLTIEDVNEEVVGRQVVDEFDKEPDWRQQAKKKLRKKKVTRV